MKFRDEAFRISCLRDIPKDVKAARLSGVIWWRRSFCVVTFAYKCSLVTNLLLSKITSLFIKPKIIVSSNTLIEERDI